MKWINPLANAKKPETIIDLRHLVFSRAASEKDRVLYRFNTKNGEGTYTYTELLDNMNGFGTALANRGLLGKTVAVLGETHPAYTTTYLAVVNGNGIIIPLDRELAEDQIANFINLSEAEVIVYTGGVNKTVAAIADKIPAVKLFIPVAPEKDAVLPENAICWYDFVEEGKKLLADGNTVYTDVELDMEKTAAIIFTSGTTGTSKGVMLSQKNLTAALNASVESMSYDDSNRFLSVLPIHHTYEMTCGQLGVIACSSEEFINDGMMKTMKNMNAYKPNSLIVVPLYLETMHRKVWSEIRRQGMEKKVRFAMKLNRVLLSLGIDKRKKFFGKITAAFGGELQTIVSGGAPLNPQIIKDFYQFGIMIMEGYGITECAPLLAVNRPGEMRLHSVGTAVSGVTVKIDKAENETEGEILAKGPNIMLGYYKNPEATAEAFTEDGWFRTGDIGYMDKDGYIYITGRKKNIIILSNGKNIYPEELEEHLSEIPAVAEKVVIGRKMENGETAIVTIIVPEYDNPALADMDDAAIEAFMKDAVAAVNKKLPSYKHVSEVEIQREPFKKTTSRKIIRHLIK